MSDCGCGSCGSCGNTPKMNGTEVTLLSGTKHSHSRQNGSESKSDLYMVLGATAVIAVVAALMAKK